MSTHDSVDRRHPSRREFLGLGLGAFVVGSMGFGFGRRTGAVVRRSIPIMGTTAEIALVHDDERLAQGAIEAAFAEMRTVERTMTRFRGDSDVGRANLHAAAGPVAIAPGTAAVLAESLRWASASDGLFDPALLRATALWDVGHRTAPPADSEVRRLAGAKLYREVELGWRGGEPVVLFHEPEMGLDLGGIAKGHAVDRAVASLRGRGIRHALVNAGGDLYALGRSPEGDPWQIGIQSPLGGGIATTLRLEDEAVATSGDYQQYFEHGGRRYHHLLDPRTGEPYRTTAHSVTIAASSCMAADAAATAVFGCEASDAARILTAAAPDARLVHTV